MSQTLYLITEAHTHVSALAPSIDNPLDGIVPNFTVFGAEFNSLWKKLLGAAWAIAMIVAVGYLMRGIVGIAQHRGGSHPSQVAESRGEAMRGGVAVAGLAALSVIVGAILIVTG